MSIFLSMYQSTIFGTSVRPRAAEGRAAPDAAGDELKRPRGDLLPRAGDADDDRGAPAFVTALERLAHRLDVADALEAVVGAAVGQLDEVRRRRSRPRFGFTKWVMPNFSPIARRAGLTSTPMIRFGAGQPRAPG